MPKDAKGHGSDPGSRFSAGQSVRFSGTAVDRSVIGSMPVTVVDPWSNKHHVTHSKGGKHYEGVHKHIPIARVERGANKYSAAKQFEAFHHDLSAE